ncbi:hypothetical protein AKJ43_00195 [candidate division MSBL1 archaeon SCGC-AAA261D19]|uniref:Uncharacterized protein n=1 Tax=candidate division MSBL1 archaeon SCGC-AAA261D19 TaxID=1698273 RepID=A0A133V8S3_9EURY|nr:hypothetical protein AKJ43_00195 [candidate division MSBL1 archaeon SCGC-AAA261D19]
MEVTIRICECLHEEAGTDLIKVPIGDRETVDTLLIKLGRRSPNLIEAVLDPRTGGLREDFDILLNGRSIQSIRGIHTKLKNKDELTISSSETE